MTTKIMILLQTLYLHRIVYLVLLLVCEKVRNLLFKKLSWIKKLLL